MDGAIIPIIYNESQEPIVSGRVLHNFLEVETPYAKWFGRMCEYGFTDGSDFTEVMDKKVQNPQGGRPACDHALKLDMAKELSMIQRNEKGRQARQYFIQIERDWNSPEKVMARALKIAEQKLNSLTTENKFLLEQKEDLQQQLDESKSWFTIKRVAAINGISWRSLDWRVLKRQSIVMGKQIQKIFDANFGEVNLYYIDVFRKVYPDLKFD